MAHRPRLHLLLGTLAYTLFLVAILLLPMNAPHPRRQYLGEYHLHLSRRSIGDVAFNVLVFVPLGWALHRAGRRVGFRPGAAMLSVGVLTALFSLGMETVQYFIPYRYSSIMDVAANTTGGLAGAWWEARVRGSP